MKTNDDYNNLESEEVKNAVSIIINNINEEIASGFKEDIDVGSYVANIVDIIKENPNIQDALVGLFEIPIDEIPISEAKKLIDTYIGKIAEKLNKTPLELKVMLGFEEIDESSNKLKESLQRIAQIDTPQIIYFTRHDKDNDKLKDYNKLV